MEPQTLTEYEHRRLENIRRNDEMMASLKLQSKANEIASGAKRQRIEAKAYKIAPEKKPKTRSPIVIRRSLRARGMPPDFSIAKSLEDDFAESLPKTPKSPEQPNPSPRNLGPLSMRDAYSGTFSDRALIDTIMDMSKNSPLSSSIEREHSCNGVSPDARFDNLVMDVKDNSKLGCLVKRESDRFKDSLDLDSLTLNPDNVARLTPGRIMNVQFFRYRERRMIVAGNKFGNVGFWNVDLKDGEADGIYLYRPHTGPISGISIQAFSLSKMFTCCYNGFVHLMDIEKENF